MEINMKGDRVELIKLRDKYTTIPPGTKGTVDFIDGVGTVHVTWDNGSNLGLIQGEDEWKTLVQQLGPRAAVISLSELGTNCWLPRRFVGDGQRCDRIYTCDYPEKKNCQAIHAEIVYLLNRKIALAKTSIEIDNTIEKLNEMVKK